jgi:hypothetical protein
MARGWAIVVGLTLLVSGCSYGRPVERLSAACPLMVSPEAGLYLDPGLVVVELPSIEDTLYTCDFKRDNETVFNVSLSEFAARGQSPATLISSISRRARGRGTTAMPGLGDAAVYYELQRRQFAVLTVAKKSGTRIRVLTLTAQVPFSQTRLAVLASVALQQL